MPSSKPSKKGRIRTFAATLNDAREGSAFALGQLLNAYRPLLLTIAEEELEPELRKKANPSDLVQETFVEAQRDFDKFTSSKEVDLGVWLKTLLRNNIVDFRRSFKETDKRDLARERPLATAEAQEFLKLLAMRKGDSPCKEMMHEEERKRVEAALERLRPEYREIIFWHNRDQMSFVEIGNKLKRSPDAVRMLWKRAIAKLTFELGEERKKR